jgi:hypothetical protein
MSGTSFDLACKRRIDRECIYSGRLKTVEGVKGARTIARYLAGSITEST